MEIYPNSPKHFLKLDFHSRIVMPKVSLIKVVSKAVYAALFAGVGYCVVGIGLTMQLLCVNSFIATAN